MRASNLRLALLPGNVQLINEQEQVLKATKIVVFLDFSTLIVNKYIVWNDG